MALAIAPPVHASETTVIPTDYTIAPLTMEQYHAMAAAGILEEGAPIELLEGYLVEKMTKHPPHAVANQLVQMALLALAPIGYYVAAQEPISLEDSEPEPDVVVVRGAVRNFIQRHPGAAEVALVVEIADASLRRDRGSKRRIYARAGIPHYWIVNLIDGCIETYSDPTNAGQQATYRRSATRYGDEELPIVIGGVEVGRLAVRDLLP
jgi:Uma2 family endonuclease